MKNFTLRPFFPLKQLGTILLVVSLVAGPSGYATEPQTPEQFQAKIEELQAQNRKLTARVAVLRSKGWLGCAAVVLSAAALGLASYTRWIAPGVANRPPAAVAADATKAEELEQLIKAYNLMQTELAALRPELEKLRDEDPDLEMATRFKVFSAHSRLLTRILKAVADRKDAKVHGLSEMFRAAGLTEPQVEQLRTKGVFDGMDYWPIQTAELDTGNETIQLSVEGPADIQRYLEKKVLDGLQLENLLDTLEKEDAQPAPQPEREPVELDNVT